MIQQRYTSQPRTDTIPFLNCYPYSGPTSIPHPYFTSVLNPFQPPFPPLSLPPQCRACGREERGKQEKRQPTVRYSFLGRRNHTARSRQHLNTPPSYHYHTSLTFHLARALVCLRADHVFLPGSQDLSSTIYLPFFRNHLPPLSSFNLSLCSIQHELALLTSFSKVASPNSEKIAWVLF